MKKRLPILSSKPTPAAAQRELAAKPVGAGSRPEFPKRDAMYRAAGIIAGSLVVGGGVASADMQKPNPPPPPQKQPVEAKKEPTPTPDPKKPAVDPALANGSVDGAAIDLKKQPKFKVYRDGGGIGPPEDMWEPGEVEAFINWTLAKEGKLALKTKHKLDFDGVSVTLDAFDPDKKMGYVYIDKLDYGPEFTKEVRAKFDAWVKAKKVAILFIDQKKNPDQATLKGKIVKFVADTKKTPMASGPL